LQYNSNNTIVISQLNHKKQKKLQDTIPNPESERDEELCRY